MSITVSPNNNRKYCEEHKLVEIQVLDPVEDAYQIKVCKMSEIKYYPFEMRLANANFEYLCCVLGIEFDHCGRVDPKLVLERLGAIDKYVFSYQDKSYHRELKKIADEAVKRNEIIVWG